ncbi:hypothetical protein Q7472_05140 [Glaesserella parasuis]|uniref:hypothetical protein n=1 Tax=Glaesserella parasuis TaxID=738 RepID=UPI0024367267|nr:hypothetical protein [Glaesserella parasuis]MDG6355269.1 hypothetical protein [Glaesserella parasuis]MDO9992581.1 hypothetical protein [Glaesserella parasuis]MDP0100483.1 hypothetical protein [Glaesserella parasuis]MDP0107413.1 hypothetical protein [Glaesserella parasuis]
MSNVAKASKHEYVLWKGDAFIAKADNVTYVLDALLDDFKALRQTTMQRVNNPKIKITMAIR